MVEAKVASGEYATENEVIRDGLYSVVARDAALEKWLMEEAVPTIDAIDSGSRRTKLLEDVRKRLHARIGILTGQISHLVEFSEVA